MTNQSNSPPVNIALVGCGLWGYNIARVCKSLNCLRSVCDLTKDRASAFAKEFGCSAQNFETICADQTIDGIIIATSASAHTQLATACLQAGKHVFIEKPMALDLSQAQSINQTAKTAHKQIMIGHLIRYHPVFEELQKQLSTGLIGKTRHIQATRLAMGRVLTTDSALYDLCPHDVSLILALTDAPLIEVTCYGVAHITPGIIDMLATGFSFENGITAHMHTSWFHPIKDHKLIVTGVAGSLVFDDTKPWTEKLTFYPDIITASKDKIVIDRKDPVYLSVTENEPLKMEIHHFLDLCRTGHPARTNGDEGVQVQHILHQMAQNMHIFPS